MITTIDNPYDPFDQYEDWVRYDLMNNYNTPALLARIARVSDAFSDKEEMDEQERAIDEIIKYDPLGIYVKVTKDVKEDDIDYEEHYKKIRKELGDLYDIL